MEQHDDLSCRRAGLGAWLGMDSGIQHEEGDVMLPCGCIPGSFMCAEAEQLWRAARVHANEYDNDAYEVAERKYDAHFIRFV